MPRQAAILQGAWSVLQLLLRAMPFAEATLMFHIQQAPYLAVTEHLLQQALTSMLMRHVSMNVLLKYLRAAAASSTLR
jgi:hypothetical protein